MNSHQKHQKKFEARIEVIKMLRHRGMALSKTGNLFQVVHAKLGTVLQHHDIYEIKKWITKDHTYLT